SRGFGPVREDCFSEGSTYSRQGSSRGSRARRRPAPPTGRAWPVCHRSSCHRRGPDTPSAPSLDIFLYRKHYYDMARATTTSDVFNAIGEPQRRRILTLLRAGEFAATEIAGELDLAASATSKHLKVLREVGLVRVREEGRQR